MDQLLFYHYLNYRKSLYRSRLEEVLNLPWFAYLSFFLTIISAVFALIFLLNKAYPMSFLALIMEIAGSECFTRYMDFYRIKTSKNTLDLRIEEWGALRNWLSDNHIQDNASILTIKQRIQESIAESKTAKQESTLRFDKWTQTLIIPVILAMITAATRQTDTIEKTIPTIFVILFMFLFIYGLLHFIHSIRWYDNSRKIAKMMAFAEDLQGVLDLDQFNLLSIDTAESKQINTDNR